MYCSAAHILVFFNATPTTEIYTLSLHDALPISMRLSRRRGVGMRGLRVELVADDAAVAEADGAAGIGRHLGLEIGKHTSELQSCFDLVRRLLLEEKKTHQPLCLRH